MPVHIDDVSSEVMTSPEAPSDDKSSGDSRWKDAEQIRKTIEYQARIELRTKAEGFDD